MRAVPFHVVLMLRCVALWLGFFSAHRLVFLLFGHTYSFQASAGEWCQTFANGLSMDLSAAGYMLALPVLCWCIGAFTAGAFFRNLAHWLQVALLVLCSLVTVSDIGLFAAWGTRINHKALSYLVYPDEAMAAAGGAPVLWPSLAVFLLLVVALWLLGKSRLKEPVAGSSFMARIPLVLFLPGLVVLAIRGGWQDYPISRSWAYFSDKQVLNLAAVNGTWNVLDVLFTPAEYASNPYSYLTSEDAEASVSKAYPAPTAPARKILTTDRPNIVLVLLESWSGDVTAPIGGEPNVSPNFTRLCNEGLLFTNFYSTGFRTEQGLCAILSSFPSQPKTTIVRQFGKFDQLPSLVRTLDSAGYNSRYTYSGDVTFANTRTYFQAMGFDVIHDETTIPGKQRTRWGAYDEDLFAFALEDMRGMQEPFVNVLMTATNHEPFIADVKSPFTGKREPDRYRNTVHYTDEWLGWFMEKSKQEAWYENTLFIIVPDHGHFLPLYRQPFEAARHHIPLLLTGPALSPEMRGGRNTTFGSHSDMATTVLNQLGLLHSPIPWGHDLLGPGPHFAYWSFDDGFGIATDERTLVWDNVAQRYLEQLGDTRANADKSEQLARGQAITQVLLDRYIGFNGQGRR
ncbi:MAG: sulfatase-like hydrolase/transferase [Flavobacteriales bacterium]|nr:MAG: sulfatase-like hydrolase/transferase [Flavobacteriales bacterium]